MDNSAKIFSQRPDKAIPSFIKDFLHHREIYTVCQLVLSPVFVYNKAIIECCRTKIFGETEAILEGIRLDKGDVTE